MRSGRWLSGVWTLLSTCGAVAGGACGVDNQTVGFEAPPTPTPPSSPPALAPAATSSAKPPESPPQQTAQCIAGTKQKVPCGRCGLREQLCSKYGTWEDVGACSDQKACSPGDEETRSTPACGYGRGAHVRVCDASCTWRPWSAACQIPKGWSKGALDDAVGITEVVSAVGTTAGVLVMGYATAGTPPARAGLYDPAADGWQVLPAPPIDPNNTKPVVVGGTVVHWDSSGTQGYALDLASKTWSAIPAPPAPLRFQPQYPPVAVEATGEILLNIGTSYGLSYNVASKTYTPIPQAPLTARTFAANEEHEPRYLVHVAVGSSAFVFGGYQCGSPDSTTTVDRICKDGALYDAVSKTWSFVSYDTVPSFRLLGRLAAASADDRVAIVWTGQPGDNTDDFREGVLLNATTKLWTPIPPAPHAVFPVADEFQDIWIHGNKVWVIDEHHFGVFDVTAGAWSALPHSFGVDRPPRVVWNGVDASFPNGPQMWVYRP